MGREGRRMEGRGDERERAGMRDRGRGGEKGVVGSPQPAKVHITFVSHL